MIIIKRLFLLILLLLPVYISSLLIKKTTFFNNEIKRDNRVIVHIKDKDLYLDLEDYVVGVVSAEMPALFQDEALKAQAVAARSYAMSKEENGMIEISSTINDQAFQDNYELKEKWKDKFSEYYKKIHKLVYDTKDLVIKREGKILKTYYFSMSNGYTEDSKTVFNDNSFISVDSPYEKKLPNYKVEMRISEDELKKDLNVDSVVIGNIVRNNTNHIETIVISNKTFSGISLRKKLNLRSTDFEFKKSGNDYIITTYGYGHGVGMSQYGANEMAKNGKKYLDILNHYYVNVKIEKI